MRSARTSLSFFAFVACVFVLRVVSAGDAAKGPIKVFILAGQSNMEGQGVVSMNDPKNYNGGKGNLVWSMEHSQSAAMMKHLKNEKGDWVVRDDVQISFRQASMSRRLSRYVSCAIQWDEVPTIPADCGYLKADFRSGRFKFPHEDLTLCDIPTGGAIVAHWLQLEGDHPSCANGQGTCEGNHEVYLDGDKNPTCECLGGEDFYGRSWGFSGIESDSYSAIVRYDRTPKGGTRVAMVRARDTDRISFRKSCKIVFTYKHDLGEPYNPTTRTGKAPALKPFLDGASLDVPYRSCIYYYRPGGVKAGAEPENARRSGGFPKNASFCRGGMHPIKALHEVSLSFVSRI